MRFVCRQIVFQAITNLAQVPSCNCAATKYYLCSIWKPWSILPCFYSITLLSFILKQNRDMFVLSIHFLCVGRFYRCWYRRSHRCSILMSICRLCVYALFAIHDQMVSDRHIRVGVSLVWPSWSKPLHTCTPFIRSDCMKLDYSPMGHGPMALWASAPGSILVLVRYEAWTSLGFHLHSNCVTDSTEL
jgi:hypothetical protein